MRLPEEDGDDVQLGSNISRKPIDMRLAILFRLNRILIFVSPFYNRQHSVLLVEAIRSVQGNFLAKQDTLHEENHTLFHRAQLLVLVDLLH